jgi:transcriptional regulator with XRE-family HTH domain
MTYSKFEQIVGDRTQLPANVRADLIREARLGKAYSIEDLAVATGLTALEISKIEAGDRTDPGHLVMIARVLGLPLGQTIGPEDSGDYPFGTLMCLSRLTSNLHGGIRCPHH